MPLRHEAASSSPVDQDGFRVPPRRQQSGHSELARYITSARQADGSSDPRISQTTSRNMTSAPSQDANTLRPQPASRTQAMMAANDTPSPTAPPSPNIMPGTPGSDPRRQGSGDSVNRLRATTLDIPGLTKSKVSPDGKISERDIGSKLVIVMVGLPARGKSYITKKLARYLNWLQHDTKIFNVGERRRVAAGGSSSRSESDDHAIITDSVDKRLSGSNMGVNGDARAYASQTAAHLLMSESTVDQSGHAMSNGSAALDGTAIGSNMSSVPELHLPDAASQAECPNMAQSTSETLEQSASFFDPSNRKAKLIREQAALETLDDLLNYILVGGGSIGILDATNSTLERRQTVMKHVKERAGQQLNVLFLESRCVDEGLLERNMRLKLSGPDYKGKDPEASLADFKKRVAMYEKSYVPLGDYEEKNNMPYVQMVDVGRKVISHQIKGFLSSQAVYYLLNFNLAPRQIWITRHGESFDNRNGKIGGDASLSPMGHHFAQALTRFTNFQRKEWAIHEREKVESSRLSPTSGDKTPPNPHYETDDSSYTEKNFCVWTSMLKRSIETADYFNEDEFDTKQMRMLNELYAGTLEGMTYAQIRATYPNEYASRVMDKLHYRYPGAGGEGYLDVINRVRPVIVELERLTDHCLIITHRSVVRVLLAYFTGLGRDRVTELDVPIGMLFCLEPKPYGVDLKAYRYNTDDEWFDLQPDYDLQKAPIATEP